MFGTLSVMFVFPTLTIYFLNAKSYIFSGFSIGASSLSLPGTLSLVISNKGWLPEDVLIQLVFVVLYEL